MLDARAIVVNGLIHVKPLPRECQLNPMALTGSAPHPFAGVLLRPGQNVTFLALQQNEHPHSRKVAGNL